MPNIVNRMVVREYTAHLEQSTSFIVVSCHGLTVAENEDLRNRLAEQGIPFRMMRNKLLRNVLADRGVELEAGSLTGNTGMAWGDAEAAIGAAKVFTDKEIKKLKVKIKGAVLDGEVLTPTEAALLADVPDRDTGRAMMLGVISGPARGLATVINAVPSAVARVLQARVDSGSEGETQEEA